MDERLFIDLGGMDKETSEDVFVEFIQVICDDDPERLMHTLSPFLLNSVLALPVDTEIIKMFQIALQIMNYMYGGFYQENMKFGNVRLKKWRSETMRDCTRTNCIIQITIILI